MIYGLYLSATGVLASSYRQDVIANNLANSETVGFKRDLAFFRERLTEARASALYPSRSNPMLEPLGGGLLAAPTRTDLSQGDLQSTSNPFDMAIQGQGFFAVREGAQVRFTRDGRFHVNAAGHLARIVGGEEVMDEEGQPIALTLGARIAVAADGTISQGGAPVARIGVWDVPDRAMLAKRGELLFAYPNAERQMRPGTGLVRSGMTERANVDPASELVALMDAQRQLEANANMIRFQDQTLSRLVNDVAKIG